MKTKLQLGNLLIFLFLLSSGSAVGVVYPNFIYPLYFFCVLINTMLCMKSTCFQLNNIIIVAVFTLFYLLNYCYFQSDSPIINSYIGNLLILYSSFILSAQMSFNDFKTIFSNIVFLIAIYCLIMYALGLTIHLDQSATMHSSMPIYGIYNYKDIGMKRSSGIFWEPGVYQIFLNLAILFIIIQDNFVFNKKNTIKLIVLVVSVLTTVSTTGYVALTFIMIHFVFRFFSAQRLITKLLLITPMIAVLVGLVILIIYSPTVYNKIFVSNTSTSIRLNDLTQSPKIIMESPLFGFGSGTQMEKYQNRMYGTIHSSVGIFLSTIRYGCIYMFLYVCRIFIFIRREFSKARLSVILLILIFSFTEGMFEFAIMYIFLFSFKNEPKTEMCDDHSGKLGKTYLKPRMGLNTRYS